MAMSNASTRRRAPVSSENYAAPALEKGLDILELLASQSSGLTQKQIADQLGRTPAEIFRMLVCLLQRGYVCRQSPADTYHLSARLFDLSHRHPPTARLLETAMPIMRQLAHHTRQSCHLVVADGQTALMLAQADSPEDQGISIRVGARFPLAQSGSGLVLLAFGELPKDGDGQAPAIRERLELIRRRGFEQRRSHTVHGVIDISRPILNHSGAAVAALTIPFLALRGRRREEIDAAHGRLADAAAAISAAIGGTEPPFQNSPSNRSDA
jgi:DNA-binding IclR family transcriptional regulator